MSMLASVQQDNMNELAFIQKVFKQNEAHIFFFK